MQLDVTKKRYSSSQQLYFSGLIELHEANYIRLRRLLPEQDALGEYAVSTVPAGLDMHYRLLEQCKYTTTFSLSYVFAEPAQGSETKRHVGLQRAPDLQIRVYHDAQLAEVISGVLHKHYLVEDHGHEARITIDELVQPQMDAIYARWRLNRFLYRWLGFCLRQGHIFRASTALDQLQADVIAKLQAG